MRRINGALALFEALAYKEGSDLGRRGFCMRKLASRLGPWWFPRKPRAKSGPAESGRLILEGPVAFSKSLHSEVVYLDLESGMERDVKDRGI